MPILPDKFNPVAPWFGTMLVNTAVAIGTGGTNVGDTTTTSYILPKPACTSCQLVGLQFTAEVAAVSASGTVLAQVFKRNNVGTPANVTITGTKSFEADVVTVADKTYPIAITATSVQNVTFASGDTCRIDVVTTNTVGTQPQIVVSGLWAIVDP